MAQRERDIMSSASKITQQATGSPWETTGSAWILNGPFSIEEGINLSQTSERMPINQTFLATTNQWLWRDGFNFYASLIFFPFQK